jgi:hypothetical protein
VDGTPADQGDSDDEPQRGVTEGPTAPYSSFASFIRLLDRLKEDGVPQLFDGSFFGQQSGSLVAQTRGTLRFFGLIKENKQPTDKLHELVAADDEGRIKILRELGEEKYASALALGTNATTGQLSEVFRAMGLTGNSVVRAITFYVSYAERVGLPLSPFFKKGKVSTPNGGSPRRTSRRRKPAVEAGQAPTVTSTPTTSIEAKKAAYIDMLMDFAKKSEQPPDAEFLDRIERVLGYDVPQEKAASPPPNEGLRGEEDSS